MASRECFRLKICLVLLLNRSSKQDRKPHWWVFIGDLKQNRIFVPPTKISDAPLYLPTSTTSGPKDRLYKLTFQAPPNAGSLSLQVHFVSDTFVGDDIHRTITVRSVL